MKKEQKVVKLSLEEYLPLYYDELKEDIPELINNINLINDEIYYLIQLYYFHEEELNAGKYEIKFDKYAVINEAKNILHNLNPQYENKFLELLHSKKIIFGKFDKSCTTNSKIYIKQKNNIEDIFVIIHEFFHFIHLEKYNYNMENAEWYTLTEMIAIMFEFYALLNMYNNHIYKNEIRKYILKLISGIYIRSDEIVIEATILNIYDKFKKIDDEAFNKYKKIKKIPDDFIELINKLALKGNPFIYHENATYIFAFPLALVAATKMNMDDEYLTKVLNVFDNINNYNIKEILDNLDLSYIISKENNYENLYQVMIQIDEFIDSVYEKEDVKRIGVIEKR